MASHQSSTASRSKPAPWSWVGKSREEFAAEVKARDFARKLAPVKLPNPGGNWRDEKRRFHSILPGQRKLTRPARTAEEV